MGKAKEAPRPPFEVNNLVRIRVRCLGYYLHRGELGRVVEVKKAVSRPVVVLFGHSRERYQPGDLEKV